MFTLVVEDDQGRKTEVPFATNSGLSIGRDKDNNVRLNERNVSRKHAKLSAGNGGIFIEDLDSYNGVKINGDRIQGKAPVFMGDRIQLGDFLLQVSGETLRHRPEEITQKTKLPKAQSGDDVTNTEPMVVAPVGGASQSFQPAQPPPAPKSNGQDRSGEFDESTALIRLNDVAPKQAAPVATVTGPSPKLVCVKGPMAGKEWPITKTEVGIGRGAENDIQIDHRSLSRAHAKIVIQGQNARIIDQDSSNGTLVNGEQYAQVDLKRGDVIELGHIKLRVVWPGEPAPKLETAADTAFDESTSVNARVSARRPQEAPRSNKPLWIAIASGVAFAIVTIVVWVAMTPGPPAVAAKPVVQPAPTPTPTPAPAPTAPPMAPPTAALDVNEVLRRANTEMAAESWDQVIRILENALEQAPNNTQLKVALEKAELERGAKATFDAAMAAFNKKDYATAKELFMQIAEGSSYYGRAIKMLSLPLVRNAKAVAQKSFFPKPPKDKPLPATEEKTEPKVAAKEPEAPAVETPRDKAKKLVDQGNQMMKANNVAGAIDAYNEAARTDPKYAPSQRGLGIAHARRGNGEAAVDHYRRYLQLSPNASDAEQVKKIIQDYETPGD